MTSLTSTERALAVLLVQVKELERRVSLLERAVPLPDDDDPTDRFVCPPDLLLKLRRLPTP